MSAPDFIPDPALQAMATKSAEKCVDIIKRKSGLNADYSDRFVPEIENLLNAMYSQMAAANLSEEDLHGLAVIFGSYLGETYRRNHGGEWGICDGTPALSFGGGFRSFPIARVIKRLTNGEEDNVHHWYLGMIQYAAGAGSSPGTPPPLPKAPPPLPEKKSFLGRLFGK